jgi:hypothetical protein
MPLSAALETEKCDHCCRLRALVRQAAVADGGGDFVALRQFVCFVLRLTGPAGRPDERPAQIWPEASGLG